MLAFEGMMNAQRNRGMYVRVGERLAEIRKPRKISQAKLAQLLRVVEGTIQNYEHGRNEPNVTRLYDAKRTDVETLKPLADSLDNYAAKFTRSPRSFGIRSNWPKITLMRNAFRIPRAAARTTASEAILTPHCRS